MNKPAVCVVIVNYRSSVLVCNCLDSLIPEIIDIGCVIVVDNCSGDSSLDVISSHVSEKHWGGICKVVSSEFNGGFSYGNNFGVNYALALSISPDYFLLLNPDTIVRKNSILSLVDFLRRNPEVGIAGSRLENIDGGLEASAHVFPSPIGELEGGARLGILSKILTRYVVTPPLRNDNHSCDWVSGASMIIRTEIFDQIGFMDEGYFLYFEEVDFCRRANLAGWGCWYVPDSVVMHLEGASTGIKEVAKRHPAYWYDSRRRYFVKYFGLLGLGLADFLWAIGRLSFLIRRFFGLGGKGENRDPKWFMFDLLWGDIKALFSGRLFGVAINKK